MRLRLAWFLTAAALASACGPGGGDDDGSSGACAALLAGDLVISEIMANPAGADEGKEWFEVYNATSAAVDLRDVVLAAARADGSNERTHTMGTLSVPAGGYVVLGDVLPAAVAGILDYGYGGDLGSMLNTAGKLSLRCGTTTIDDAVYDEMQDGVARGYTGTAAPDHQGNDDLGRWCDATVEYEPGSTGSPGAANEMCGVIMPPGQCDDQGAPRPTVPPVLGDLVISEYMPSPDGTDATAEWFEVYVTRDVDLNGLEIGRALGDPDTTITQADCARATAGSYLVFARSADMVMNAGLPRVDYVYQATALAGSGALVLSLGGVLLDQVSWATAFTGESSSLDPDSLDPAANDVAGAFCAGVGAYGTLANMGTPGAANAQCPLVVPPGMCDAGGTLRPIVKPTAGQLAPTEVLANTLGAEVDEKEWFEVLATAAFDLNGVQIGQAPPTVRLTLTATTCLSVSAGTHLVFAGSMDMAMNGGLPQVHFVKNFALTASGANAALFVGIDGTVLDAITWTLAPEATSRQLDPDFTNPTGNDLEANFCDAVPTYGAEGYKGTPGAANPQCP